MTARPRQIVTLGGGGFLMEPENPRLDRYILGLAPVARPRVLFLPTASGDNPDFVRRFRAAFGRLDCEPEHLLLVAESPRDAEERITGADVVYVGGGNSMDMLSVWRRRGVDRALSRAWKSGVVLAGVSAGSLCWYRSGVTDSIPGALNPMRALGFLPGSNCPHYDGERERRPAFQKLVAERFLPDGWAADDGVALHWVDRTLHRVVSSRPGARAWRVERRPDGVSEQAIVPDLLPA